MRVIGYMHTISENDDQSMTFFNQIPRFCYRQNFDPILDSKYKSDRGWGCCLRSTQGMIAQYILHLYSQFSAIYKKTFSRFLKTEMASPLSLFFDSQEAPFSIHNIISSAKDQIIPGVWAKPSIAAESINNIFNSLSLSCIIFKNFQISSKLEKITYPCLLLLPCLFGLNKFDMTFLPLLEALICMEGSLGFISGKGNSAYYIVGFEENSFIYFDPHYTKPAFLKEGEDDIKSLYSIKPKKIRMDKINPSILIGLMVRSDNELENLQIIMTGVNYSPFSILDEPEDEIMSQVIDIDDLDLNEENENNKEDEFTC